MGDPGRRVELRAATPIRVGDVTVLPVERVVLRSARGRGAVWVAAEVEPCGLVVRDAGGLRAVALDGTPLALGDLRARVPAVEELYLVSMRT